MMGWGGLAAIGNWGVYGWSVHMAGRMLGRTECAVTDGYELM